MSRSRPASNPLSFHKHSGQYYVTRGGKRIYLGADQDEAMEKYYHLQLGVTIQKPPAKQVSLTLKELANRYLASQQANWRNPEETLRSYRDWLGRFLKDNPKVRVQDFTVEIFATWKLSLRKRGYSPESINHYLSAVRSMFLFAEETDLIEKAPRLRRIKNESFIKVGSEKKPLYNSEQIKILLKEAKLQMKAMILLGLNCGFGPKDLRDLTWDDIRDDRVTLPRSKTGVSQTFLLWPETKISLDDIRKERRTLIARLEKRDRFRTDNGHVFVTKYWNPWNKDAVAEEFRKLCLKTEIPCYGIYRLRHCASTAISSVTNPHVQRKFMRHKRLQQQVTYTHTPDVEVDEAITKAKLEIFGKKGFTSTLENDPEQEVVA